MTFRRNQLCWFVLGMIALLFVGCGGKQRPDEGDPETWARKSELAEIYDLYASYVKANQRAPQKLTDLIPAGSGVEAAYPQGVRLLQTEAYVVVWGTDINGQPEAVLAYPKNAATAGGWVLLANGTAKKMTADEFKAAKK